MERGVVRFLAGRLGEAAARLSGPDAPDDEAIHDARRALKDARAALRLLRPRLGAARARREDRAL
ncbi:MAG: hypothetical protein KGM24_04940, partial [Elusimicrobia bacterium]|nr:hypothetical protein [Elusimicrobiota bacterium]